MGDGIENAYLALASPLAGHEATNTFIIKELKTELAMTRGSR